MMSALIIFNQHFTRSQKQCDKVRKETEGKYIRKGEVKLSLITDDLIIHEKES